jgi:hypothetical protein
MPPPETESVQELTIVINWATAAPPARPTPPARLGVRQEPRQLPTDIQAVKTIEEYIAVLASGIPDFDNQVAALTGPSGRMARNIEVDMAYDVVPFVTRPGDYFASATLQARGQPKTAAQWTVLCRAKNGDLPQFTDRDNKPHDMAHICNQVKWRP